MSPMGQVTNATTSEHATAHQHGDVQLGDRRMRPQPEAKAEDRLREAGSSASAKEQFVELDGRFDLEHAGRFIRLWCRACDKFEHLSNDRPGTVDADRSVHRCGARTSDWERGDLGVRA